jgi:Uncharacterized protein conserved in bacteria (DUF2252)
MMSVTDSTAQYERWLAKRLVLIHDDLALKHENMAKNAFSFLRASFYRWVDVWAEVCPTLGDAPRVLAVGDLHVENFGTWRDSDGRLAWGVNDFDEAQAAPYTNDLVRLCTSAVLAAEQSPWRISVRSACEAILGGYRESLVRGGTPIVLGMRHGWLRELAESRLEDEPRFWSRLAELDAVRTPARVRRLLMRAMPESGLQFRVVHRVGGLGSLGRQRFTAITQWCGGFVAREAKALAGSAWRWRRAGDDRIPIRYEDLVHRAARARDPSLHVQDGWVVRRLAPDCRKVELKELSRKEDLHRLLRMMGWEAGNVHLASRRQRRAVLLDLGRRKPPWLRDAAERMAEATVKDWRVWRKEHG